MSEESTGTVVGILNEDLNSGTVVALPQSPISIELEAAKGLLALKSEGKTMNQTSQQKSLSSSIPENVPPELAISDSSTPAPQAYNIETVQPKKEIGKTPENLELSKVNEPSQNVETTMVETTTQTEPADIMPPGGVVISPLPSRPVSPLNLHPINKTVETERIDPSSHSAISTSKPNHVEMITAPTNYSLETKALLNKCGVKLAKLSDKDVKRLCGKRATSGDLQKIECDTSVETPYRTRSSVKPKPKPN